MTRTKTSDTINKKSLSVAGLILAASLSLGACNTIEGIGEDTESVGEAVQDAAQ